jgi:hypothetical protein
MSSKPKGVQPRGVQPKRSGIVKLASQDVIEAVKQPLPSGQLEATPQSFAGTPSPTDKKAERIFAQSMINPLIKPPAVPPPRPKPEDTGPSLPKAPIAKRKPLQHVDTTPDYTPRKHKLKETDQEIIDEKYPELKGYQIAQNDIESKNPYLTDTIIYTPQTRKSYYRFISDNYMETFKLIPEIKGRIDEDACAKLGAAAGITVEAFMYQKFIREYIRNAAPYRGILVYHGLGSGKTCSAIAAAEALYGTSNKKIIVMTPYSLRANFISEVSFCGFKHFNVNNHWVKESLISEGGITYIYARSILSLDATYLKNVLERPEEDRKVIWIPDFTKPANYDQLSQQERDDIRAQITNSIENRIEFVSYNGVTATQLKRWACAVDRKGNRFFDNAVIVIDEVHNLTRLMQDEVVPYTVKRKGRPRKIPVEPIVPGKWVPGLCGSPLNYKRAYLFYKLLTDARNSKIIGLSGTPIINFPSELGTLANILTGYTECAKFTLSTTDKSIISQLKKIAEAEPRVDIVRIKAQDRTSDVIISVFNEGYERVQNEDNEFIGVKYNAEAQDGIKTVFERIKEKLIAEKIPIGTEDYVSYPRLPIDSDEFKDEFIDTKDLSVKNSLVLQKRLTGLISYYKGSKDEYMPRVVKDEVVKCEMSDYVLSNYTSVRKGEIEGELKKKESGDKFADVELFAKMKAPSNYRFRSRALCNFTFPKGIERPFPDSVEEIEEETEDIEDVNFGEADTMVEEDLAAQEAVAEEDKMITGPEGEEESEEEDSEGEEEQWTGEEDKEEAIDIERAEEKKEEVTIGGGKRRPMVAQFPSSTEFVPIPVSEPVPVPVSEPELAQEDTRPRRRVPRIAPSMPSQIGGGDEDSITKDETKPVTPEPAPVQIKRKRPVVAPQPVPQPKPEPKPEEETKSTAAAEYKATQEKPVSKSVKYQQLLKNAMQTLEENKDKYLKLDSPIQEARLVQYSTKLDHMIRRIQISKGSNLVYSQFKTVEGLGVLGLALKANGYKEIVIEGGDWMPRAQRASTDNSLRFSQETIESLRKGPDSGEKRFIFFTGEGLREKRNIILNIFNGNFDKIPENMRSVLEESGYGPRKNRYGEICWVIGITGAGAEGISLKCCRSVHIMEPYWNNVRLDQVKGRAVRICSHQDLPYKDREVEVYTYYTVFSADQKNNNKIDISIMQSDEGATSDENVYNISVRKDKINQEILKIMRESAMDCGLNAADNDNVSCFIVDGKPDQYIFDPDLQVDKLLTSIEFKEVVEETKDITETEALIEKELGEKAPPSSKPDTQRIPVMAFSGVEYLMNPKKGSGGLIFELFAKTDDRLKTPIGEISVNPATGTFKGSKPTFK